MNIPSHATMALFDSELREEFFLLLELAEVKNYTHFIGLHGSSQHGKKEGTVAWPGTNEIVMLILNDDEKARFFETVENYKQERPKNPPLLTFTWKLSEFV
jgi:hypothetical protein